MALYAKRKGAGSRIIDRKMLIKNSFLGVGAIPQTPSSKPIMGGQLKVCWEHRVTLPIQLPFPLPDCSKYISQNSFEQIMSRVRSEFQQLYNSSGHYIALHKGDPCFQGCTMNTRFSIYKCGCLSCSAIGFLVASSRLRRGCRSFFVSMLTCSLREPR